MRLFLRGVGGGRKEVDKKNTFYKVYRKITQIIHLQITYFVPFINFVTDIPLQRSSVDILDQFTFLGNFPPTPLLSHHFALSEK